MRKHFLILMLLTLLPFTAWADIVVTPGVATKIYGENDPSVGTSMFSYTGDLGGHTKAQLAAVLTFVRIQNGETAGYTYDYTLVPTAAAAEAMGQDVIVSGNGKLNIIAKDIATVADPAIPEQMFHVGNWNAPEFELAGLTLGTDYTIEGYTNSAGEEITGKGDNNEVTVKGIGNYKGTTTYNFNIAALSVGTGTAPIASIAGVFAEYDYTYDGTAKAIPAYTIKETVGEGQVNITEFFDFAEPVELTNAGDKEITATAKAASNYTGSFKFHFTIEGKPIKDLTFAPVANETYKGAAFTPTPTVTDGALEYVLTNEGGSPDVTYAYEDNINAGTAKVTVTGHNNYAGTKEITFTIAKRNLADINITAIPAAPYTGAAQTPDVTAAATDGITTLPVVYNAELETGDFTVAYANNTIASTDAQKATATITAVEASNYTGSKSVEFTINKVELTVTPKNFTKIIGDEDPTNEDLVSNEYYTITGFVNDETVLTAGVTGAPVFAIADHTETVGDKDGVITISSVAGLSAQNYSFAAGAAADLTIAATSAVTIAFNDNIQVTYGDEAALAAITTPANAKNYITVEGLVEDENYVTSMTIAFVDAEGNAVVPKNVGTYYLKATPATITINENQGNYNFADVEIANGSFEIVARPIAFKAVNQTLTYGEAPNTTNTGADYIELVSGSYAYTDGRSDMNLTLTVDPSYTGAVGEHTGVLILGASNDNYDFTLTDGNILVVAGAGALDLATIDAADVYDKIQDYDNVPCNVVIPFGDRTRAYKAGGTEYGWAAEKWNTLVLPFDITVAELSKTLGYAIVNVIDEKRTEVDGENSKVYGKLTMKGGNGSDEVLVANKPFMLKTTEPITGNVTFEGVTIKAPQSIEDCTVDAGKGVKFIGTYAEKEVSATDNGKIWFMEGDETEWATIFEGSTSTWTLVPFEGYVDLNGAAGARNITFIMEELDGSATAIKSVNADKLNGKIAEGMYNMNGMKMNSVPTQKGVYIVNGKKVVIK